MRTYLRQRVVLKDLSRAMTTADLLDDWRARKRWRARLAEPMPPPLAPLNRRQGKGRSRYLGVYYRGHESPAKRWAAQIQWEGRWQRLGIFATEEEAARTYDRRARELYGAAAICNFEEDPWLDSGDSRPKG